jgi:hypothetical protein
MYNIYGVNKKRGSYEPLLFQSKSDITFDYILSCSGILSISVFISLFSVSNICDQQFLSLKLYNQICHIKMLILFQVRHTECFPSS